MAQYRVKALLEVEYDAKYTCKMTNALKDAEDFIIAVFSNNKLLRSCKLKKLKIQTEDSEKEEKENGILERSYRKPRQ